MQRYGTAVPLGAGSFADVYRCFDSQLQRTVALKVLRRNEPEPVERMFREARAQAKVDHEGVCKVYATGWRDGRPYIAMQLVEGEDLLTTARRLSLRRRLHLMVKVAEAVQAAHQRGLVHRDLKPENILVQKEADGRLRPVVVDFGLAYDLEVSSGRMTRNGEPVGTPAFMSPEQAAGRLDKIDARTDVYGLGATLYVLLTGKPPFDSTGTTDLLIKALESEPVPPRERLPTVPAEVEQIILKCLEKKRSRRYPSAQGLADDLQRYLHGDPVLAVGSGWWNPLRRRARRHRRGLAAAGVIVGISAMALWSADQKAREISRRAEHEQRLLQISSDLDWAFRAAQMSSAHDITPSRKWVRQQIVELERELEQLKVDNRGPAHYAIGRAYAALHEDETARRHLESAWQLGHRPPELGYFLGLVIGRQYEDALERVRHVSEPELRKGFLDDAVARYRDPAKAYLEAGRKAEAVSVEYVEALIDFYEERYDQALVKLAEVRRTLPWLYEAMLAEGKVYRRLAEKHFAESRIEQALELYHRAEAAYRQALASASSDPHIYPELCRLVSLRIESELDWSIPPTDSALTEHLELCDRGLEVDPLSSRAHRASALAYELVARVAMDRSWHPQRARKLIEHAEYLAKEGVQIQPEEPDLHSTLAVIRMTRGRLARVVDNFGDPLEIYLSASDSLRQALRLSDGPRDPIQLRIAWNHQYIAHVLSERWQPADDYFRQAADSIRENLSLAPRSFTLQCDLGHAELSLAFELRRQGKAYAENLTLADAAYQQCLALNGKYHWAYIGLAEVQNARILADCVDGQYDVSGLQRARQMVDKVTTLDPGFAGGLRYQANFRVTAALCRQMGKESSAAELRAIAQLARQMEAQGQNTGFFTALGHNLELRRGLTLVQDADLKGPLEALSRSPLGTGERTTISRRLYRLDQLLWMAEASWQMGQSGQDYILEAEKILQNLKVLNSGELAELPQIQTLHTILSLVQIKESQGTVPVDLDRYEARLRGLLNDLPSMAPHVQPWLDRIDLLRRRVA